MSKIPLTLNGAELLRAELHELKTVARPNVVAAIAEARSHGDLSENAEYDAAKEKQGFIEGRIKEIEGKLARAQIIDPKTLNANGKCVFGATVELEDLDNETHVTYQIVGEDEVDPAEGKVSLLSPIGKILLGKKEGENLVLDERAYTIFNVRYESAESEESSESEESAESSESPEIAESSESEESPESSESPEIAESPENPENAALYEKLSKLRAQMAESLSRGGASFTEQHLEALDARLRLLESQKMRKSTVND